MNNYMNSNTDSYFSAVAKHSNALVSVKNAEIERLKLELAFIEKKVKAECDLTLKAKNEELATLKAILAEKDSYWKQRYDTDVVLRLESEMETARLVARADHWMITELDIIFGPERNKLVPPDVIPTERAIEL